MSPSRQQQSRDRPKQPVLEVRDSQVPAELKKDDYRRYSQFTLLILVWGACIVAYVVVLEKAVKDHNYLGIRGSEARTRNFDVLAFFRTGFATIHIPVVVSVLGSTVPYLTMVRSREEIETNLPFPSSGTDDAKQGPSIIQLFYLADRTWAGLFGWTKTGYNSFLTARPSLSWLHLALVAGLTYIGFPLISVAYVVQSSQYWDSEQIAAATALGGLNSTFDQALMSEYDPHQWIGGDFFALAHSGELEMANLSIIPSSSPSTGAYSYPFYWSNGDYVVTLPLDGSINAQLSPAAIQVNISSSFSNYNHTNFVQTGDAGIEYGNANETAVELLFDFNEVGPNDNSGLPYKLSCKQSCNTTSNQDDQSCISNSSLLQMWPSDDYKYPNYSTRPPTYPVSPTFTGQTLTCGSVVNDSTTQFGATARIQLAVQGPGAWTSVRTFQLSIAYVKPVINTLLSQYMQASVEQSSASSLQNPQGLSPFKLMLLSIAGPLSLFHNGPPSAGPGAIPLTDGFKWVGWVSDEGASRINATFFEPGGYGYNGSYNPWDLLYRGLFPEDSAGYRFTPTGNSLFQPNYINENTFLGPLASIISNPEFFTNGSTNGVVFKTDLELVYGRVPAGLAVAVLMLPVVWTLMLSGIANTQKGWTANLDAYAMFRLGGDWRGNLKELRLASLFQVRKELASIPGIVRVDPQKGLAELACAPHWTDRRRAAAVTMKEELQQWVKKAVANSREWYANVRTSSNRSVIYKAIAG